MAINHDFFTAATAVATRSGALVIPSGVSALAEVVKSGNATVALSVGGESSLVVTDADADGSYQFVGPCFIDMEITARVSGQVDAGVRS